MAAGMGKPDNWSEQSYRSAADFVHRLTTKVVDYLDAQPSDHILDLGCGDGKLTVQIATVASKGRIHGLDNSTNFIEYAQKTFPSAFHPNLSFELFDCTRLEQFASRNPGSFDKVFSNAALHWILGDSATRRPVLKAAYDLLKPGGKFALEMGGAGNVAEVVTAMMAGVVHAGVPLQEAQAANPWFFPSDVLMGKLLKEAGFDVEKVELEYRPTKLESGQGGGIEGWVRLMGASFLDTVQPSKREDTVRYVCDMLRPICRREEGGEWLGYVRCRAVARKRLEAAVSA